MRVRLVPSGERDGRRGLRCYLARLPGFEGVELEDDADLEVADELIPYLRGIAARFGLEVHRGAPG